MTSNENIADALSHITKILASKRCVQDEEYVREVTLQALQVVLRIENIEEVPFQEKELKPVETGHWSKVPKAYELVSHELACIGQVVLRGTKIVVPRKLI